MHDRFRRQQAADAKTGARGAVQQRRMQREILAAHAGNRRQAQAAQGFVFVAVERVVDLETAAEGEAHRREYGIDLRTFEDRGTTHDCGDIHAFWCDHLARFVFDPDRAVRIGFARLIVHSVQLEADAAGIRRQHDAHPHRLHIEHHGLEPVDILQPGDASSGRRQGRGLHRHFQIGDPGQNPVVTEAMVAQEEFVGPEKFRVRLFFQRRDIGVDQRVQHRRGFDRRPGLHPVTLSLEGISGQRDATATARRIQAGPIDCSAVDPVPRQRWQIALRQPAGDLRDRGVEPRDDRRVAFRGIAMPGPRTAAQRAVLGVGAQGFEQRSSGVDHERDPEFVRDASYLQRVGGIEHADRGIGMEALRKLQRHRSERGFLACGQHEHGRGIGDGIRTHIVDVFLDDDVAVGAARTERTQTGQARHFDAHAVAFDRRP